jgi:hypothetical protein
MKKSKEELERDIAAYLAEGRRPAGAADDDASPSAEAFRPRFKPCSEEDFNDKFEVLPPIGMSRSGFLVGEPWSHRTCRVTGRYLPTYQAMVKRNGRCFQSCEGITLPEWRELDIASLRVP